MPLFFGSVQSDTGFYGVNNVDKEMKKIADMLENNILPKPKKYVEVGTREVEVGTHEVQIGTQEAEVGTQEIGIGTQENEFGTQEVEFGTQEIENGTQEVEVGTQENEFGTQEFNLSNFLYLITQNPKISRKEIADYFKISVRTLQRKINSFGNIKYVGSGKNGKWTIKKD